MHPISGVFHANPSHDCGTDILCGQRLLPSICCPHQAGPVVPILAHAGERIQVIHDLGRHHLHCLSVGNRIYNISMDALVSTSNTTAFLGKEVTSPDFYLRSLLLTCEPRTLASLSTLSGILLSQMMPFGDTDSARTIQMFSSKASSPTPVPTCSWTSSSLLYRCRCGSTTTWNERRAWP